ncbi:MAG: PP0621 family protein [Burkholderiaceae bacterium]|nr:PP0621 family protein [Burkholderiaceae bacterium]
MKFFLLLGLFLLVVWLVRGGRRSLPPRADPPPTSTDEAPAHPSGHEEMVACVHCGVHLPQSEAVGASAGWFCGQAHRIAHENSAPPR